MLTVLFQDWKQKDWTPGSTEQEEAAGPDFWLLEPGPPLLRSRSSKEVVLQPIAWRRQFPTCTRLKCQPRETAGDATHPRGLPISRTCLLGNAGMNSQHARLAALLMLGDELIQDSHHATIGSLEVARQKPMLNTELIYW